MTLPRQSLFLLEDSVSIMDFLNNPEFDVDGRRTVLASDNSARVFDEDLLASNAQGVSPDFLWLSLVDLGLTLCSERPRFKKLVGSGGSLDSKFLSLVRWRRSE